MYNNNGVLYTLMSALFSIFSTTKVEDVYSYILDFGNNALINLRTLPHVAEYITMDDEEKIGKFIKGNRAKAINIVYIYKI